MLNYLIASNRLAQKAKNGQMVKISSAKKLKKGRIQAHLTLSREAAGFNLSPQGGWQGSTQVEKESSAERIA